MDRGLRTSAAGAWSPTRSVAVPGVLLAVLCLAPPRAEAQVIGIDDPETEYARLLQISGHDVPSSFTVRPTPLASFVASGDSEHPWAARIAATALGNDDSGPVLSLADTWARAYLNARNPTGQNDGVVWQGKGLTTALDFGAVLRWRALTLRVQPTVVFTQNAGFGLAPVWYGGAPEYAYPWRRIDLPQRFGPESFWTLDPGQSEIALAWRGVRIGFGTRNLWWGPGIENAIVMSNNAGGFPHGFLGTNGPVDIGIGTLEAHWIWGRLEQSDWFDPTVTSTERFLTGAVLAYSPEFLPGLTLGATRMFYTYISDDGVPFGDYLAVFQGVRKKGFATPDNPLGDDEHDQLFSLFWRWVLPESGFELFGEWARNDHSWDLVDFITEPEHSEGHTLGLQKTFPAGPGRMLGLRAELTHLQRSRTVELRPSPVYYAHHIVTQGYTHRGQVLGAGVGPGGNSQILSGDLYVDWGRVGAFVQREVHDGDAYHAYALANGLTFCCHNVSLRLGTQGVYFFDSFDLGGRVVLTREFNRYFSDKEVWNLSLGLSARWRDSSRP